MLNKSAWFIIMLISLSSCSSKKTILSNLDQSQENLAILILEQNNISTTRVLDKNGTYRIEINSSNEKDALQILKDNGFPKESLSSLGEVFKKDGFISSPLEEHSRFLFALDQELEGMIGNIDGVTQVKVSVNLPMSADNLWNDSQQKSTASVLIKYKSGYNIEIYSNKIKQLVANSVPNLSPNNVIVLSIAN